MKEQGVDERHLTIGEFCRRWSITRQTAARWHRQGRIKFLKADRRVVVERSEVERFEAACRA